jgi:hypothetical protein
MLEVGVTAASFFFFSFSAARAAAFLSLFFCLHAQLRRVWRTGWWRARVG